MCWSRLFLVCLCYAASGSWATAQSPNDIFNLLSGAMRAAVTHARLAEWKKLPLSELDCLAQQFGVSVLESKIQQGATVNDPDVQAARAVCRSITAQSQAPRSQPTPSGTYVVDGLALGAQVHFDSEAYQSYRCTPSEQFGGFTWCQRQREERTARGQFSSIYSILHAADGTALYINRYLEPAWFAPNEANEDIARLSKKHGSPALTIPIPSQAAAKEGVIVVWGNVVLQPVDQRTSSLLAAGQEVRVGLMIDHIGNFQRSAQQGLPIYRLTGGAGYVWAASWNQKGVGTLRFLAIDPMALTAPNNVAGTTTFIMPKDSDDALKTVAKEETERFEATKQKASKGSAEAQFDLANMYVSGRGTAKNEMEAITWLRKAADQGLTSAQKAIGDTYYFGIGSNKDQTEAANWYRKAADQGDAEGQYKLGLLYANGEGVERNSALATEWMQKAATKGSQQAKNWLDQQAAQAKLLQEARDKGFETVDEYEQFKADQNNLAKSGIRLKSR